MVFCFVSYDPEGDRKYKHKCTPHKPLTYKEPWKHDWFLMSRHSRQRRENIDRYGKIVTENALNTDCLTERPEVEILLAHTCEALNSAYTEGLGIIPTKLGRAERGPFWNVNSPCCASQSTMDSSRKGSSFRIQSEQGICECLIQDLQDRHGTHLRRHMGDYDVICLCTSFLHVSSSVQSSVCICWLIRYHKMLKESDLQMRITWWVHFRPIERRWCIRTLRSMIFHPRVQSASHCTKSSSWKIVLREFNVPSSIYCTHVHSTVSSHASPLSLGVRGRIPIRTR